MPVADAGGVARPRTKEIQCKGSKYTRSSKEGQPISEEIKKEMARKRHIKANCISFVTTA